MFSITKKVQMEKIYCVVCRKYRKFKNLKYQTFSKNISSFYFCSKCKNEDKKYLKNKDQLRYEKYLIYLKIYNYFKIMVEESISQEFRLKM